MTNEIKKLYRSQTDRMIWGVCGGLGKYFNADPTLFRALFVLLMLFNGVGIFLYVFLAIIIPVEPLKGAVKEEKSETGIAAEAAREKNSEGMGKRNMLGLFIVLLGLVLLLGQFFPYYLRWLTWELIGAVMIIGAGVYLIFKK